MTVEHYDLVVSLGTDHHPFDRLIGWVDQYLAAHSEVKALVQHGFTTAPQHGEAVNRMPRADLLEIYRAAKVVLVQGGPGSILDAREVGLIPLAVPRRASLGEVVDDHQVEFSRVMQEHGEAILVTSAEDLAAKLDAALADPASVRGTERVPASDAAANRLTAALEPVLAQQAGADRFRPVRRLLQIIKGLR
ncbi:glycosyltransferase [Rothia nasimurium]|uniref:glycosyltransferase n=1 Tax=Rothia nasimurium TaxID=85336 RepID=UPI003B9DC6D6